MYISGVNIQGLNITSQSYITANLVMNLDAGLTSSFSGNTTWRDTANGLTFTLYNTPTFSSNNGGYLNFAPASAQWADSPNQSFGSLSRWTVEVWHYFTNTNSAGLPCILTEYFTGGSINFSLGSNTNTGLQSGWYTGWQTTPAYTLSPNTWNHIVGTYDGAANKLFVNNSLVQSAAATGNPTSSGNGIRLMRRWDNPDYWGGRLSIVRIYNTAFSNVQIDQNYQAVRSRFGI